MSERLKASSAAAIVLACCALGAQPPDRAPAATASALSRRAADRLSSLHEEADRLAARERTVLSDLRRLELDREIKSEEAQQADADAAAVAGELTTLDAEVTAIAEQERASIPDLRERLIGLYKLGRGRYARLLLSTSDVRQMGRATRMVAALANLDRARIETHRRRLEDLAASRKTLEERRKQFATLREDALLAQDAVDRSVAARNALVRTIDERRDLNAQLSGELIAAQEKLQAIVSGMAAGSANGVAAALPIGPFQGDLDWPIVGRLRQGFGSRENGRRASSGIDVAAPEGTPVRAVHDGTVAYADAFAGFGRLVIVDHGSQTFTLYGNLKDIEVSRGAHVDHGTPLGSAGVAPTGAEGLYFELRIDGRAVDPLQWLKKR